MPANIDSMAYYGKKPWHNQGVQVQNAISAKEMIQAAGLDWEVEMRPARGAKENKKGEASRYEIVRLPRDSRVEEEVLFGVVSKRYKPLQNFEAFGFFDPLIGQGKAHFETAGALGQGDKVWVMAKMPEAMEIVPGDECMRYLLLSNSHAGDGSVLVKFTPVRVVCQNTLFLAMEDGQKAYRVRHSKMMHQRLDELTELMATTQKVFMMGKDLFTQFAKIQLKKTNFEQYLDMVYPKSEKQRKERTTPQKWSSVIDLFETSGNLQMSRVRGTLWAAYNAITQYEDYKLLRKEEGQEERLNRVWFGNSADIKLKALEKAKEYTKTQCV